MPKFFMLGIVLSLLLGAGYGIATLQARSIPWDCADWQAFAHADRTTAILESLAENRGKTLYCGVDQSDTFTKTETWEAGKDRNERDDTVYFGERGQFRGFIAAQEGYLTEGESGVTGVSIDRIFEFPREERRRVKRVKRRDITSEGNCPDPHPNQGDSHLPGTLACSGWGNSSGAHGSLNTARRWARGQQVRGSNGNGWVLNWETQVVTNTAGNNVLGTGRPNSEQWQEIAETAAKNACRAQGYPQVTNVVFGRGHNRDRDETDTGHADYTGVYLRWFFHDPALGAGNHRARARQSRTWTATCKKVIRRTRK